MEWLEWNREPDTAALERATSIQDFSEAEAAYKLLINRGSILGMVNLGSWFEFRPEVSDGPDLVQAEFWYRKAVDSGSAVATLPVGYFYLRKKDYEKAREIFEIGMQLGYAPSIVRLADLYLQGLGVGKDYGRAKELLKNAIGAGNLWAKIALGAMTYNLASNPWIKYKGYVMTVFAALQFKFQEWREPRSERLRK